MLVWPLGVAKQRLKALPEAPAEKKSKALVANREVLLLLFFLVGFVALGGEVLWTRYLGLFVHTTAYTYTITLSVVLLGIVLGSFVASRWFDRSKIRGRYLGALQVLIGLSILVLMLLPATFWIERSGEPWIVFFYSCLPPFSRAQPSRWPFACVSRTHGTQVSVPEP